MDTSPNLSGFVNDVARNTWPFAVTILVTALVSTALIQMIKDLLPVRRWFQRSFVRNWFRARMLSQGDRAIPDFAEAEKDLIHLATGGDAAAFYSLEVEQLCGQMNSAAQIALAYASRHKDLLCYLAPEADPADVQQLLSAPEFAARDQSQLTQDQAQAGVTALLDSRNRVAHHVQRGIDALQISMGSRWKLILQFAVYAICFGVAFVGVFCINPNGGNKLFDAVIIGVLAGFISPILRDLMAVLGRLRKP